MKQTPKIGIDRLWVILRESRLLAPEDFSRAQQAFASLNNNELQQDSGAIAKWLVREKLLTPLQTKVMLAGHSGPFDFGRYRVLERVAQRDIWIARDRKTGHLVWLHFFRGDSREDLQQWNEIEFLAEQCCSIDHPNFTKIYECVVTREFRFVATAIGGSESLADKMSLKRRLTEPQSLEIITHVAAAIAELESHGIQHGSLSLEYVFPNVKKGSPKVVLPLTHDLQRSNSSDVVALGRMLFRLLTGREAPHSEKISKVGLKKFSATLGSKEVSSKSSELIYDAITNETSVTAAKFLQRASEISGNDWIAKADSRVLRTEPAFLDSLSPWAIPAPVVDDSVPEMSANGTEAVTPVRRSGQWPVAASLAATLVAFAALLGIVALMANLKKLDPPRPEVAKLENTPLPDAAKEEAAVGSAQPKLVDLDSQSYVQELVADDQQTLWESPTTGFPIDVSSVPPSPRLIAAIKWKSIYDSEFGSRSINSLGPRVESMIRQLESRVGFALTEVDSTVVSFHSNLALEYDSFVMVKLANPVSQNQCLDNWQQPAPIPGIANAFGDAGGDAWWIKESDPDSGNVLSFVVGPFELVQQVSRGEVAALSGTLRKMAASSDSSRDVSLLLPIVSLFNTEGQKLFAGVKKWMNEFRLVLPEAVRGISISLHHDEGDYLEFRVDHTSELKSKETAKLMRDRIRSKLDQSRLTLQQRQAAPYWEPIRARFGGMLRDLSDQLRWDSEFGEVVGNAWLPPGAVHNLFAATELAIAFEPQIPTLASTTKLKTPQSLEELLSIRRDLNIANPPDLNVLLKDIREEISDQYLDLPFEFNIRIAGTDLQKEGITQNQRPGPLEISNQSVSDILTQVMVSANPNREINGASDPNCKLVWVVTEEVDSPDVKFVLITTRAAAAQNGYVLPEAFQAKP
jgi:serine/threonine protein kinase